MSQQSQGKLDSFGLVGPLIDGKYELIQCVAEGGFGVVYKALDHSMGASCGLQGAQAQGLRAQSTTSHFQILPRRVRDHFTHHPLQRGASL